MTEVFDGMKACPVPGPVPLALHEQIGLYIVTGGTLRVKMPATGEEVTEIPVSDGAMFKGRVVEVMDGTTASGIFALIKGA